MKVYLTRDSDLDGNPSIQVDVWLTRPVRHVVEGGAVWTDGRFTPLHVTFTPLHVTVAESRYGRVPTTDAVCLAVEVDP